ncbi:MAG: polysaccharide pyruvyl transferase family protein [Rhodobacteraceae bacterium]|nr:polysaccharide pyruvyl transferase family protein [Paracoccaceae bacterium]
MSDVATNPMPLRLFWWQGVANFGDTLSALIVSQVSGRKVSHAGPGGCEMLAIGSLIQVMRRKYREPRGDGVRPWIWGAGLLHSVPVDFLDNVQVGLLRGPVTAALLGVKTNQYGDPGLLTPLILGPLPARNDRIGLVMHHSQADDPEVADLIAREPALELIDVGGNTKEVCRKIAACAHVIASSLHGLVVADACGVANTWLSPGTQSHLKYHDYGASIGRAMIAPLAIVDIPGHVAGLKDQHGLGYSEAIEHAREALLDTFPAALRGPKKPSGQPEPEMMRV